MSAGAAFMLTVSEASQAGEARRRASALAAGLDFDASDAGRVALVVTELATNLVKHAGGGQLLVQSLDGGGVEVLALDQGPGMASVDRCLQDGYSTAGSPGTGLGAIARLSDGVDIHSVVGVGTAILVRVRARTRPGARASGRLDVGAVCVPHPGEEVAGDAWRVIEDADALIVLVADGLGHGVLTAAAARAATESLGENVARTPAEIVEGVHAALRSTRGAAVGVAKIDSRRQVVRFSGVGNIAAVVLAGGDARHLVSHHGTAGHEVRRIGEFTYPWPAGALLVLHSDGISSHWSLDRYPGLTARPASLIAGVLYRDFKRGRDDATVVVAREQPNGASA